MPEGELVQGVDKLEPMPGIPLVVVLSGTLLVGGSELILADEGTVGGID